jgi:hypothetical protein
LANRLWLSSLCNTAALARNVPEVALPPIAVEKEKVNRIIQLDPAQATGKTRQLFETVQVKWGAVPNLFRVLGVSPVANVALSIFANYVNHAARTVVDFSEVQPGNGLGATTPECA